MVDDAARLDAQWIASLSDTEAKTRIDNGCDVVFENFPSGVSLCFDLRVYDRGIRCIRGIPHSSNIHIVSLLGDGLRGGPPGSMCVGCFVACALSKLICISYRDDVASLRIESLLDNNGPFVSSRGAVEDSRRSRLGERGVALYTEPHEESWRSLSNHIDEQVLRHVACISVSTPIVVDQECQGSRFLSQSLAIEDAKGKAYPSTSDELADPTIQVLRLRPLPRMHRSSADSASQITEFNMDRSPYVMWLVAARYSGRIEGFLGELQLSFLAFLVLRSISGLQQWMAIALEISRCQDLTIDSPELIAMFMTCLRGQLQLIDADVLGALGSDAERLRNGVMALIIRAKDLVPEALSLGEFLQSRFGWVPSEEL